jgi:hypothetical protein
MNNMMLLIKDEQLEVVTSQFDLRCLIRLKVRSAKLEEIIAKMEKIEGIITREIVQE